MKLCEFVDIRPDRYWWRRNEIIYAPKHGDHAQAICSNIEKFTIPASMCSDIKFIDQTMLASEDDIKKYASLLSTALKNGWSRINLYRGELFVQSADKDTAIKAIKSARRRHDPQSYTIDIGPNADNPEISFSMNNFQIDKFIKYGRIDENIVDETTIEAYWYNTLNDQNVKIPKGLTHNIILMTTDSVIDSPPIKDRRLGQPEILATAFKNGWIRLAIVKSKKNIAYASGQNEKNILKALRWLRRINHNQWDEIVITVKDNNLAEYIISDVDNYLKFGKIK
ncbi:MAG: hypothetical protein WC284_11770 [Candidimonas sp.]